MANPQLVTYIKQQMGLGESEAQIKNSLRGVGWAEPDILDAVKTANPGAAPATSPTPASQAPAMNPSPSRPAAPAMNPPPSMPMQPSGAAQPRKLNIEAFAPITSSPMTRPLSASPAVISFTAQKPVENVFQPQGQSGQQMPPMSAVPAVMAVVPQSAKKGSSWITILLMGLIIVALGALSGLLYKNNADLKAKADDFTNQISVLAGRVTNSATADATLTARVTALEAANADLDAQLALFLPLRMTTSAAPTSSSTTSTPPVSTPVPLTLKGTLSSKTGYILTTSKGIAVNIKNSKDAKVDAALKPLLNATIELTGIPTSGVREITVTHVNGAAIQ